MTRFSILWTLLFGPIYLAIKGVWTHAVALLGLVLALTIVLAGFLATFSGIFAFFVWVIYAFFAPRVIANNYLKKGWKEVS